MSPTNSDRTTGVPTGVPAGVPAELATALEQFSALRRVLVVSDFDGTLAPLLPQPMAVAGHPEGMQALIELSQCNNTHVALLSGRDRSTLRLLAQRTGPAGRDVSDDDDDQVRDLGSIVLAGSHGAESEATGAHLSTADIDIRDAIHAAAQDIAVPGVIIEKKPAGVVFHTAQIQDSAYALELQKQFTDRVDELGAEHPSVGWNEGKDIIEVHVTTINKGTWIEKARHYYEADAILFAGDDTTDENAFAALDTDRGDLGIKVGEGETCATFRVADTDAISAAYAFLVPLRQNASA